MALSLRQSEILEIARGEGRVLVDDLAQRFDVALQTIRRDLADLSGAGLLDRVRAEELFGFEYVLEMYKPAAKRRWGYFALPILRGDELIGKLDAKADRKAGVLRVFAVHRDRDWTTGEVADVHAEIRSLADWLGLELADSDD